jgi:hypothetical protein
MPTEKKRPKREKKVFFIVKYGTFEEHGFLLLPPFFVAKIISERYRSTNLQREIRAAKRWSKNTKLLVEAIHNKIPNPPFCPD